jgi:hypothetical protein
MRQYKKNISKPEVEEKQEVTVSFLDEEEPGAIRILLVGRSKSGRTTFSLTFPKPLIVDVDHGLTAHRDKHLMKVDVKSGIRTHQFMISLLNKLINKEEPFDKNYPETLIIDDLSGLSEQYEKEVIMFDPPTEKGKVRTDGLFLQDYNTIQNRMISFLTLLRDVPVKYVVVVASVYYQSNSDLGGYFETPAATGQKFPPRIASYFDEVYHVEANGGNYRIRTRPTDTFPYGGTKHGVKEDVIEEPAFSKLKKYFEPKKKK